MGRVALVLLVLLMASLCSAQIPLTRGWGWTTHRFVASEAVELLADVGWFFSTYSGVIVEWSTMPDKLKGTDPYWLPPLHERYRHWYHVDVPHTEDEYWHGVLPWAVENRFDAFVQYLSEENWVGAAQTAGIIAHYVGDASQPLHTTRYYNPCGKHGPFEGSVNQHLDEVDLEVDGYIPEVLENVFDSTMELLEESYGDVEILSYEICYVSLWNPTVEEIVESRLEASVKLLADILFTGLVRANLVVPAVVDLDPDVLNLMSKGKFITAYIELPSSYSVENIDVSALRLIVSGSEVQAELRPTEIGDHDGDGVPDLMVKFDRRDVQVLMPSPAEYKIALKGEVGEILLWGWATISAIRPGKQ
jgi:hypothetical protein